MESILTSDSVTEEDLATDRVLRQIGDEMQPGANNPYLRIVGSFQFL
jgi:hypothetical protein